MEKLTTEQIEAKAAELSVEFGNTVTPIVFISDDGSQVVGYCQEPEYDIMMYATDAYMGKEMSKLAEAAVKNCLIVKDSDPRILSTKRCDGKIRASFASACLKLVTPYIDQYKKK